MPGPIRIALPLVLAVVIVAAVVLLVSHHGGSGDGAHGTGPVRARSVSVYPSPGTRFAEPRTQIAFRGIPAKDLGRITVIGSRSGRHAGRIEADSDGDGGSFLPSQPFRSGETVRVRTGLRILDGRRGTFSFRIADVAPQLTPTAGYRLTRIPNDVLSFHTQPGFHPATVKELTAGKAAPGDLFIAPQDGPLQNGAMIVRPDGRLIWWYPVAANTFVSDLRKQTYQGKPVLTWWQGGTGAGVGIGEDVIMNTQYHRVAVVRAANGLDTDLHEFTLTPRGTALVTAYFPVFVNASGVKGGYRHKLTFDAVAQEIDIKTGLVLFEWDSLDHVPLKDNHLPVPVNPRHPFDPFHINSIQEDSSGSFVISGRSTWGVYKVSRATGKVIWTLGSPQSDFRLGPGAQFVFQHDVQVSQHDTTVTMFDDGAGPPTVHQHARGLTLHLNFAAKTATVVRTLHHSPELHSDFEGDMQHLPNGDYLLGWGQQPYFTEFNAAGQIVYDGRFVDGNANYRAYKYTWVANPTTRPALTVDGDTAYVSWNGATRVASWRVLTGTSSGRLGAGGTVPDRAFETAIPLPARSQLVEVQALDEQGTVLGTSAVAREAG